MPAADALAYAAVLWVWGWSLVLAPIIAVHGRRVEAFVTALLLGPIGVIVAACLRHHPPTARPCSR